jgi:hypothetical protein
MPLTARLTSPLALYRKLEREAYRAFHAKTPLHKADHFFNFCVTAASMRDYTLEHLGKLLRSQQQPYYQQWANEPTLVAAAEIANSAKHFVLRDKSTGVLKPAKTRTMRLKKSAFVEIYAESGGNGLGVKVERTEVSITLSDGKVVELYAFTEEVLKYWKAFLKTIGFRVRRQPFSELAGK